MSEIGKKQDRGKKYDQRKSHGQFLGAGPKASCKRGTHSYLVEPRRRVKGLRATISYPEKVGYLLCPVFHSLGKSAGELGRNDTRMVKKLKRVEIA